MKLIEILNQIKGTLWLPESLVSEADSHHLEISRVAPIATAKAGEITFFANEAYAPYLETTGASVVIVPKAMPYIPRLQIIHEAPYRAFAQVAQMFVVQNKPAPGVRPGAMVASTAEIDPLAIVMPGVWVGENAKIGEGAWLFPGVFIGEGAVIGSFTELRSNVVIEHGVSIGNHCLIHAGTVVGADGFGFAPSLEGHVKIPQVGSVRIGDHVEIGALCTIDRGALEDTVVGRGTKLDSHVHIGHGVVIGEHCLLCAFSGIAGSAKLGNWVVTGGHSAVNNRCEIVDFSQIGGMSALTKSALKKDTYMGFPAQPAAQWRRQVAASRRQADLEKRVRFLEKALGAKGSFEEEKKSADEA
jgi:UDP-3-O-[3-hydroxymyristoyl] glucosamine N-acyltransferase